MFADQFLTICDPATVDGAIGGAALVVHLVERQRLRVRCNRYKFKLFLSWFVDMLLRSGSGEFFRAKSDLLDKKSSLFDLNLAQASLHVNCQKEEGNTRFFPNWIWKYIRRKAYFLLHFTLLIQMVYEAVNIFQANIISWGKQKKEISTKKFLPR